MGFRVEGNYPENRIIANAPVIVHSYQAMGDGSYAHDSGFFFATGRGGLALTAGAAIGRAIGNSHRRAAAQRQAQPNWYPIDSGQVFVNQFGFYLRTRTDLLFWGWDSILECQMVDRGKVIFLGESLQGRVNYILETDAAELIFALWSLVSQPMHVQFQQKIWLLPEWLEKYGRRFGEQAIDFLGETHPEHYLNP